MTAGLTELGLTVMALTGEEKKAYQRELMRKRRAEKRGEQVVEVNPVPLAPEMKVAVAWEKEKYPNKQAFAIAVERSERAKRYAQMFPHLIGSDDLKFQTLDWQYENEGLKAPAS